MISSTLALLLLTTPLDKPQPEPAADSYQAALIAAIHHFTEAGEPDHLKAVLEKHPKLIDARRVFRQPHKPSRPDGYAPLHHAAERGRDEIVAYLIGKGADVNAADGLGWTPLHLAAQTGRLDVVKQLVKAGAKIDARTVAIPESYGVGPSSPPGAQPRKSPAIPSFTPLQLAEEHKYADVAAFLNAAAR